MIQIYALHHNITSHSTLQIDLDNVTINLAIVPDSLLTLREKHLGCAVFFGPWILSKYANQRPAPSLRIEAWNHPEDKTV
jgi:hypothetical protein